MHCESGNQIKRVMKKPTIYFLHGLDSSGSGTKGRFFQSNFPQIISPDFEGTLADRLLHLENLCMTDERLIFIGSSFGGLMATCYACQNKERVAKLILLAPALNFESYQPPANCLQIPTQLIIGKHDTVTPPKLVLPLAEATFEDLTTTVTDDDHLLHSSFQNLNWQKLTDV